MIWAFIILAVIIFVIIVLGVIKKSLKALAITLFIIVTSSTVFVSISKPKMHKPFAINIVEYLIKINDNGDITTTTKTTVTEMKESRKD